MPETTSSSPFITSITKGFHDIQLPDGRVVQIILDYEEDAREWVVTAVPHEDHDSWEEVIFNHEDDADAWDALARPETVFTWMALTGYVTPAKPTPCAAFDQFVSAALGAPQKPILIERAPVIMQHFLFALDMSDED